MPSPCQALKTTPVPFIVKDPVGFKLQIGEMTFLKRQSICSLRLFSAERNAHLAGGSHEGRVPLSSHVHPSAL